MKEKGRRDSNKSFFGWFFGWFDNLTRGFVQQANNRWSLFDKQITRGCSEDESSLQKDNVSRVEQISTADQGESEPIMIQTESVGAIEKKKETEKKEKQKNKNKIKVEQANSGNDLIV